MNIDYLSGIGEIWKKEDYPSTHVIDESVQQYVRDIIHTFNQKERKSVVVTGDRGVGKSTIIDRVCLELHQQNWKIFVATASQIMAGQKYIGELEQRVKEVINELKFSKKSLWVIPQFHETYYVGRTNLDPLGILDQMLLALSNSEILVLGESPTSQLEKVLQVKPAVRNAVDTLTVKGRSLEATDLLAAQWVKNHPNEKLWGHASLELLQEVNSLARQYLPKQEEPGLVFDFLKSTNDLYQGEINRNHLEYQDFVEALSKITGFPAELLDDQKKLELATLEGTFNQRIVGQPEAVRSIVERIAMVKAGLTDPLRPLGVFLFVGPTGTGKTEVAKTLVKYLFGNEDRMIRLDMSEFQTADDLVRITGGYQGGDVESLISQVRKQPFSVILLDEFEKAHQRIWDLFLQVFDDGRLTDDEGAVADFRNSIIILTSNTGASDKLPPRIGFGETADSKAALNNSIIRSLQQTFRMEFLNRIDRIICFNPLDADAVRKILKIELKKVLQRRGFRRRKWEVEWEDSAIDLLMKHGFDPEMGARPMKRAIEELLLAPLAITIVNHHFPKGDQFLFVRAHGDRLKVDFVDPVEPNVNWEDKAKQVSSEQKRSENITLDDIILHPRGKLSEKEAIQREWNAFISEITEEKLQEEKESLIQEMSDPHFWQKEDRYETLSDIEFLDRYLHSYKNLKSLIERMSEGEKPQLKYPADLLQRTANRLRLLKLSIKAYHESEYQECFLTIDLNEEDLRKEHAYELFQNQVAMYQEWARARQMNFKKLISPNPQKPYAAFLFTGFAARQILRGEAGLHLWVAEPSSIKAKEHRKTTKYRIKVDCFPCPDPSGEIDALKGALQNASTTQEEHSTEIIRTYKKGSNTLVKDHVRGWQTARFEWVINGHFDVIQP